MSTTTHQGGLLAGRHRGSPICLADSRLQLAPVPIGSRKSRCDLFGRVAVDGCSGDSERSSDDRDRLAVGPHPTSESSVTSVQGWRSADLEAT